MLPALLQMTEQIPVLLNPGVFHLLGLSKDGSTFKTENILPCRKPHLSVVTPKGNPCGLLLVLERCGLTASVVTALGGLPGST